MRCNNLYMIIQNAI